MSNWPSHRVVALPADILCCPKCGHDLGQKFVSEWGGWKAREYDKTIFARGVPVVLHIPLLARFLKRLVLARGAVVTRADMWDSLYWHMHEVDRPKSQKILDVMTCKLRNQLAAAGLGKPLQTIWGIGWRLEELT